MDTDGDGVIEKEELLHLFNNNSKSHLTEVEITNILNVIDTNGSGKIDFT
jgi:Ca2+-binding EF-hand superfamily protein